MTQRAADRYRPRIIIPAAAGLPVLDAAAVWILGAVQFLLRRGRPALRDSWLWVECFDDLMERMVLIREHTEPPANRCPLIPVRMPVEVDVRPEPGEVLPPEYAERELGAPDNRRLAGKVAQVLIDHIALHQQAAVRHREKAQRNDSSDAASKADAFAMQVRSRAHKALRGVDLEELARAVQIEAAARPAPDPAGQRSSAGRSGEDAGPSIQWVNDKKAIVTEGNTVVHVNGSTQVRVFRAVVEAAGRPVSWSDLVRSDIAAAGVELERRWRDAEEWRRRDDDDQTNDDAEDPSTPRHATEEETLQRTGNRIRKALGKLGFYWSQDGHGAWWTGEVS